MFLLPIILPFFTSPSLGSALFEHAEELTSLPDFPLKFLILNLLGTAVVLLHVFAMFGVHLQLIGQLRPSASRLEEPAPERLAEDVRRYQRLRSRLERLLSFCAANIGFTILIPGQMRNLLKETAPGPLELMPAGSVVIFGVYFTWLLAIIYLPIRKTRNEVGQALAEDLVQHSIESPVTWRQWLEERQAIRSRLGLQGSGLQDLQQGLAVLAPLLAGISSLVLGAGA
jgi:hypothetical protein